MLSFQAPLVVVRRSGFYAGYFGSEAAIAALFFAGRQRECHGHPFTQRRGIDEMLPVAQTAQGRGATCKG